MLLLTSITACKKQATSREIEGGADKVSISQVILHGRNNTTEVITQARVGTMIRIEGSGFASAVAIYVNGVKVNVNPNFVTENNIIMTIPATIAFGSGVGAAENRNTIRIVTKTDDFIYKFVIQGPSPVISDVSHTLARTGETMTLTGTNLRDITSLVLPGNITVSPSDMQFSTDFTTIKFKLPAGAALTPGSLHLIGDNGDAYSYNYLNRYEGVFIKAFTADANRAYNFGTNISATFSATLPATGDGHKNPEFYRQVPAVPADAAVETTVGGFNFRTDAAITSVIQTSNGNITAATPCNNLALQFDVFIPVEWSSGWLRIDFISGNANWRYNYAPWAVAGATKPVTMNGWQTVTMPLGAFRALTNQNMQYFVDQTKNAAGVFSFVNGTLTDSGGAVYPPKVIRAFQMSFGNFRIVPYVKGPNL
ncbi:MAG: hypothetical protein EON51_15645 [Acinetobacter sp.]|nr:MAG: hypothetical protein EON51_15645 [Acinetobacter sp.]